MRELPQLQTMRLLQPGNRLSITPVSEAEWQAVLAPPAENNDNERRA